MAKRYIDTKLWDKTWFRRLEVWQKSVWLYLITRCDHAGIIDFDSDSDSNEMNWHKFLKFSAQERPGKNVFSDIIL